jgi:hypothetical protein
MPSRHRVFQPRGEENALRAFDTLDAPAFGLLRGFGEAEWAAFFCKSVARRDDAKAVAEASKRKCNANATLLLRGEDVDGLQEEALREAGYDLDSPGELRQMATEGHLERVELLLGLGLNRGTRRLVRTAVRGTAGPHRDLHGAGRARRRERARA